MSSEVMLGFLYLESTLAGDGTLAGYAPGGVHRALAPIATAPPFTIMGYMAGTTTTNFGAIRGYVSALYQVKAVGPATAMAALVAAAGRIDTLITTSVPVNVTGGIIKSCVQTQPIEMDETVNGEQWTNVGGLYRIMITAT